MYKSVVLGISCLCLTACSSYYSSSGEKYYLQSRNGKEVVVPPPLTAKNLSHFYDLPPQNQDPSVSIEPPKG